MMRVALRAVMLHEDDGAVVCSYRIGKAVQAIDEALCIMPGRRIRERALLHVDDDQGVLHLASHHVGLNLGSL